MTAREHGQPSGEGASAYRRVIVCEGPLFKLRSDLDLGPSLFGWQSRYFILEGDRLFYYHGKPPPGPPPPAAYSLALADVSEISLAAPLSGGLFGRPSFLFRLHTPSRTLVMKSDIRADYDRWVRVLRMHIEARRERAGLAPPRGMGGREWSSGTRTGGPSRSLSGRPASTAPTPIVPPSGGGPDMWAPVATSTSIVTLSNLLMAGLETDASPVPSVSASRAGSASNSFMGLPGSVDPDDFAASRHEE
jgi:hypothetical protein